MAVTLTMGLGGVAVMVKKVSKCVEDIAGFIYDFLGFT